MEQLRLLDIIVLLRESIIIMLFLLRVCVRGERGYNDLLLYIYTGIINGSLFIRE